MDFKLDGYDNSEIIIEKGTWDQDDEYCKWFRLKFNIKNDYFNFNNERECLLELELKRIYRILNLSLSNELENDEDLSFIEPDIELYVSESKSDDHNHLCDFKIMMYYNDCGYSGDYYSILLGDNEIKLLRDYIGKILNEI